MMNISDAVRQLPLLLGDLPRWPAGLYPERVAIETDGRTMTYAELEEDVASLAARLLAHGVASERWGVAIEPGVDFFVRLFALLRAGAVVAPLPHRAPTMAIARMAEESRLDAVVAMRDGEPYVERYAGGAATGRRNRIIDLDAALILRTSGSTGSSRSVLFQHHAILANLWSNIGAMRYADSDRTLVVLPLHHAYALVHQALCHLAIGGTVVIPRPPLLPPRLWQELKSSRATNVSTVPAIARFLAQGLAASRAALPDLRLVTIGAARVPAEVLLDLRRLLPHARIAVTYGLTEAGPRVATKFIDSGEIDPCCVGTPLPNVDVIIGGDRSAEEIVVRSRSVACAPASSCFEPRELKTGDIGAFQGGEIRLAGRAAPTINRAGVTIAAEAIERVLGEHPVVEDVRVHAAADGLWGEVPVATVTLADGGAVTESELLLFCASRLPREECPSRITFASRMLSKEGSLLAQFAEAPS